MKDLTWTGVVLQDIGGACINKNVYGPNMAPCGAPQIKSLVKLSRKQSVDDVLWAVWDFNH